MGATPLDFYDPKPSWTSAGVRMASEGMRLRLFVALHLEPRLIAKVKETQDRLRTADTRSEVRWVGPQAFHLTLAFLGEVEEPGRNLAETAIGAALVPLPAPRLGLGDLGAFPRRSEPRVIWIGVIAADTGLVDLAGAVIAAVRDAGMDIDDRPFEPHLTLGRVRAERAKLADPLRAALSVPVSWTATLVPHSRVGLVRSHLSAGGSRYEMLHDWHLAEPR